MELNRRNLYEVVSNAIRDGVTSSTWSGCQNYCSVIDNFIEENHPEWKVIRAYSVNAPNKTKEILGFPAPHAYLLVTDGQKGFIVDGSISQFITHFEDLSSEVLGIKQSYFVGSRAELKELVCAASKNSLRYLQEHGEEHGLDAKKIKSLDDIHLNNLADSRKIQELFPFKLIARNGKEQKNTHYGIPDSVPVLKNGPQYPTTMFSHYPQSKLFERQWGNKSLVRVSNNAKQSEIDTIKYVFNNEVAIVKNRSREWHEPKDNKKSLHKVIRRHSFVSMVNEKTDGNTTLPSL